MKRELLLIAGGGILGGLTSFLGVHLSSPVSQIKAGQPEIIAATEVTAQAATPTGLGWEVVVTPLLIAFVLALASFAVARRRARD